MEVRGDDLLDRYEPLAIGHHHEARQQRRHLDPREVRLLRVRVEDHDAQVHREVRDVRERMSRVERDTRRGDFVEPDRRRWWDKLVSRKTDSE